MWTNHHAATQSWPCRQRQVPIVLGLWVATIALPKVEWVCVAPTRLPDHSWWPPNAHRCNQAQECVCSARLNRRKARWPQWKTAPTQWRNQDWPPVSLVSDRISAGARAEPQTPRHSERATFLAETNAGANTWPLVGRVAIAPHSAQSSCRQAGAFVPARTTPQIYLLQAQVECWPPTTLTIPSRHKPPMIAGGNRAGALQKKLMLHGDTRGVKNLHATLWNIQNLA